MAFVALITGASSGIGEATARRLARDVGLVLPGFVKTEGFPTAELLARPTTRWMVSTPEVVAEAILEAGPGGRAERYMPRYYWIAVALRVGAPGLVRRAVADGALSTSTRPRG